MDKSHFQVVLICFVGLFLFQSCIYSGDSVLEQRRKDQLGKYVIDMERTEWGEYEAEKEKYKDLTIVFKKDMTFEVNRSVPFLLDTTGQYVIRGSGKLCDIRFPSLIEKYGDEYIGNWLWPCWEESSGDSVTAIITPISQQNEQRQIPKIYFRKIGHF